MLYMCTLCGVCVRYVWYCGVCVCDECMFVCVMSMCVCSSVWCVFDMRIRGVCVAHLCGIFVWYMYLVCLCGINVCGTV